MLRHRVVSGFCLGGGIIALVVVAPVTLLALVIVATSLLLAIEFSRLLDRGGFADDRRFSLAAPVIILGVTYAMLRYPCWPGGPSLQGAVVGSALWGVALLLVTLFSTRGDPLHRLAATFLNAAYVVTPLAFLMGVLGGWEHGDGRYLGLYMVVVVKFSDIGAYFTGRFFGKHKVFPRISPAKTWEGCLGGIGLSVALSILAAILFGDRLRPDGVAVPVAHAAPLGLALALAGIFGDLIESMFKRAAAIKDSGDWIKGMGGMLDVMDSLLLASPVLYLYLLCAT